MYLTTLYYGPSSDFFGKKDESGRKAKGACIPSHNKQHHTNIPFFEMVTKKSSIGQKKSSIPGILSSIDPSFLYIARNCFSWTAFFSLDRFFMTKNPKNHQGKQTPSKAASKAASRAETNKDPRRPDTDRDQRQRPRPRPNARPRPSFKTKFQDQHQHQHQHRSPVHRLSICIPYFLLQSCIVLP